MATRTSSVGAWLIASLAIEWSLVAGSWGMLLLGSAASAFAADRFVSTVGNDTANDCASSGAPCRTVAHAVAQAGSGDTVKVAGGSYAEGLLIDFPITLNLMGGWAADFGTRDLKKHRTTFPHVTHQFRADGGETVDIHLDGFEFPQGEVDVVGTADGAVHATVDACKFSGWTLRADHGGSGVLDLVVTGTTFSGSNPRVPQSFVVDAAGSSTVNVTVQESTFSRGLFGGIVFETLGTATSALAVDRSVFKGNRIPITAVGGGAIKVFANGGSTTVGVTNSVFSHNSVARPGIYATGVGGAVAIFSQNAAPIGATFVNDTIVRNRIGGGGEAAGLFASGNATVSLKNVILWGNPANVGNDLVLEGGAVADADHDDIGIFLGPVNDLGGNVSVDPRLIRGFELSSTSPLIDAGTCTGAPSDDIQGDPRPSGPGCDIGADEFVP